MKVVIKKLIAGVSVSVTGLMMCATSASGTDSALEDTTATINVETYNIFSIVHEDQFPDNAWVDRRAAVGEIIGQEDNDPDILAIQEGQDAQQVADLIDVLGPTWENYTTDVDISPRSIFWKDTVFDEVEHGMIEVIGPEYEGYDIQRYGSYVRLEHREAGEELMVLNVHLPSGATEILHEVRHSAALNIADLVKEWSNTHDDMPVIVLGDFNSYYDTVIGGYASGPMTLTESGLPDTYGAAAPETRLNPDYETKLNIVEARTNPGEDGSRRLDYIHTYPTDRVEVLNWRNIIDFAPGSDIEVRTPVPSDHNPVSSLLRLSWE